MTKPYLNHYACGIGVLKVPRGNTGSEKIYQIDKSVNRIVKLKGNHLVTVRTDAMEQQLELYCEEGDAFFYGFNNEVTIKFVRNHNGDVVNLIKHQSGKDEAATKMK